MVNNGVSFTLQFKTTNSPNANNDHIVEIFTNSSFRFTMAPIAITKIIPIAVIDILLSKFSHQYIFSLTSVLDGIAIKDV